MPARIWLVSSSIARSSVPKVRLAYILVVRNVRRRPRHYNSSGLDHVCVARQLQCKFGILLDDHDGDLLLTVDFCEDSEEITYDQRRQTKRRLVKQHEARTKHESTSHGEHLLLSSGKCACLLASPFLELRKVHVHPIDIAGDGPVVVSANCAETEIFVDRHPREGPAPLGDMRNAEPHQVLRRPRTQLYPVEADGTRKANHVADRSQRRCFSGSVGPQKRCYATLAQRKVYAVKCLHLTVICAQFANFEDITHVALLPR